MKVEVEHVFQYAVSLNSDLDYLRLPVYTNFDFTKKYEDVGMSQFESHLRVEDDIKDIVFNKEKIEQLKKELCEKIMACENPFNICCVDWDGGYLVEEKDILENQIDFKKRFGEQ